MGAGKFAAQAGHAFTECLLGPHQEDVRSRPYLKQRPGTKIVLVAPTALELKRAERTLRKRGVPCALIYDQGHRLPPDFDGGPVLTALGFGPARPDEVRAVTKALALAP